MQDEFYWLTLSALLIALFWVPYVLNRFVEIGIFPTMTVAGTVTVAKSPWAQRAKRAHAHAIENFVIFAALVFAVSATGSADALTASAAKFYFLATAAHFAFYVGGLPVVRTVAFLIAFGCQMVLGLSVLGVL